MSDLPAIIARLEASGRADREIAFDVFYAIEADAHQRAKIDAARKRITAGELSKNDLFAWRTFGESCSLRAVMGSLDACAALQERELPGWRRDVDATLPDAGVDVTLCAHGTQVTGTHRLENRAWLIAILRAVEAERERGLEGATG